MALAIAPPADRTRSGGRRPALFAIALCGLAATAFGGLGVAIAIEPVLVVGALAGCGLVALWLVRPSYGIAVWSVSFFIPYSAAGNALLKAGFALALITTMLRFVAAPTELLEHLRAHRLLLSATALLYAWLVASTVWADDTGAAVGELAIWWLASIVLVTVLVTSVNLDELLVVVVGIVVGATIAAATALMGSGPAVTTVDGVATRSGGAAGDPNILAAGLVAALALAPGLWSMTDSPTLRISLLVSSLAAATGIAASASRGALVAAVIAIVATIAVSRRPIRAMAAVAVPAAASLAAWATLWPASWHRVTDFGGGGTGRTELWRAAFHLWSTRPLTGVGIGNLVVAEPAVALDLGPLNYAELIAERPLVAHNVALQLLSEVGLVGLVLYGIVVAVSIRSTAEAVRRFEAVNRDDLAHLARSVLVATVALLSAGLFLSMSREYRLWLFLAIGPALLAIARSTPAIDIDTEHAAAGSPDTARRITRS
jgi:hypothetical protein